LNIQTFSENDYSAKHGHFYKINDITNHGVRFEKLMQFLKKSNYEVIIALNDRYSMTQIYQVWKYSNGRNESENKNEKDDQAAQNLKLEFLD
jgi:hypothetical protein